MPRLELKVMQGQKIRLKYPGGEILIEPRQGGQDMPKSALVFTAPKEVQIDRIKNVRLVESGRNVSKEAAGSRQTQNRRRSQQRM